MPLCTLNDNNCESVDSWIIAMLRISFSHLNQDFHSGNLMLR